MAEYSFVTTWKLDAPIDRVWSALYASEDWPVWWKGVKRVTKLAPGDKKGVGALYRYTWRSVLPYNLVFTMLLTKMEEPHAIEGIASGELAGTGRWALSYEGGITTVRYYWQIRTTKAWMNLFAPVARPLFKWNHDAVMGWGAEGLARLLGARLLSSGSGEHS